jgi:general secretion pathway protein C
LKSNLLTQRNVFYLNVVLGILLTIAILVFVRDAISISYEKKTASKKSTTAQTVVSGGQKNMQLAEYAPVLKNNPFGFPGGEIQPLTGSAGSGKQVNFVLVGTVVGPRNLSYAVFKDNTGMQEVFKTGESVFNSGILHEVRQEKAIIRNGARMTEVPLDDIKVREITKQGAPQHGLAQKVGRGAYMVDQARLQQAIANPGQMMTDARLRPNMMNGKEEGFVLSEVKPGGIYQSLGLQDGDVLLRINEYEISNPERALQAFTALKGLDRVQVDLIRSGSRVTMTYQIK